MIAKTSGRPISITGLGCHVPERVLGNDELSTIVDTNDEWIVERTGIRERRIAADDEALTDLCLPAARRALEMAGAADKISTGTLDIPELPESGRDEVSRLARSFNRMRRSLEKAISLIDDK